MPTPRFRPIVRLFVSSTFSDLKHERNALHREVFPKLEQLCSRRGFQFQAIDLRWGVPTEAALDHRTMQICLEELRRSQEVSPRPNFLILLGDRYGWRPLPEQIPAADFERLKSAAAQIQQAEIQKQQKDERLCRAAEILENWYLLDENARPKDGEQFGEYVLRSRLKPLAGIDYGKERGEDGVARDTPAWLDAQFVLWAIVNRAFPVGDLATRFPSTTSSEKDLPAVVRFQASATEQEIWHGALQARDAGEHVVAVLRKIDNLDQFARDPRARDFVDVDQEGQLDSTARSALTALQEELGSRLGEVYVAQKVVLRETSDSAGNSALDVTTDHLADFCDAVLKRLQTLIEQQLDEYWQPNVTSAAPDEAPEVGRAARELELERDAQRRFADERAPVDGVVGREEETRRILAYLAGNDTRPFVVHGVSGSGKTALVAHAARRAAAEHPRGVTLARFLGTTPRSSNLRELLVNLCRELRAVFPREGEVPTDLRELVSEFYGQLAQATADRPIHLFLDALDQLEETDGARQLDWIRSTPLSPHAKLVVSCLSDRQVDEHATEPYDALQRRGLLANSLAIDSLTFEQARALFFDTWLADAGRRLTTAQQQAVLKRIEPRANRECRTPLYLKILFEAVRRWRSFDETPEIGASVSLLLAGTFDRLSKNTEHGPTVEAATSYLVSARYGLAESELLEILFDDPDYQAWLQSASANHRHELPVDARRVPIALWSRLRYDLAPYLSERGAPGGSVLHFYHRQVEEYVRARFLSQPAQRSLRHDRLKEYFANPARHPWFLESLEEQRSRGVAPYSARPANLRKVTELPAQFFASIRAAQRAGDRAAAIRGSLGLEALFSNLSFLEAKNEGGLLFELVRDFDAALALLAEMKLTEIGVAETTLRKLRDVLRRESLFVHLRRDDYPQALFQCLWNGSVAEGVTDEEPETSADGDHTLQRLLARWLREKCDLVPNFFWLRESSSAPPANAPRRLFSIPTSLRRCAAASHDGTLIAIADKTCEVWDVSQGRCIATYGTTPEAEPKQPASSSYNIVRMNKSGLGSRTYLGNTSGRGDRGVGGGDIACLQFDGQSLLMGFDDHRIVRWHFATSAVETIYEPPEPGKKLLAFCIQQGNVLLAEAESLRLASLKDYQTLATVLLPEGSKHYTRKALLKVAELWSLRSEVELPIPSTGSARMISLSSRGIAVANHTCRLSTLSESQIWQQVESTNASSHSDAPEFWFPCVGSDSFIQPQAGSGEPLFNMHRVQPASLLQYESVHPATLHCTSAVSQNDRVVAGAQNGSLHFFDLQSSNSSYSWHAHAAPVTACEIAENGAYAVSLGMDGRVNLWELSACDAAAAPEVHASLGSITAVSSDGQVRASSTADGKVLVHRHYPHRLLRLLTPAARLSTAVALSANGELVANGTAQGDLQVWETSSGKELLKLHMTSINCLAFSPGAQFLAVGGAELKICALKTGTPLLSLGTHANWVTAVAFSNNGKLLAASNLDGTLRVWDLQEMGKEILFSARVKYPLRYVRFAQDDETLVFGWEPMIDDTVTYAVDRGHQRSAGFFVRRSEDVFGFRKSQHLTSELEVKTNADVGIHNNRYCCDGVSVEFDRYGQSNDVEVRLASGGHGWLDESACLRAECSQNESTLLLVRRYDSRAFSVMHGDAAHASPTWRPSLASYIDGLDPTRFIPCAVEQNDKLVTGGCAPVELAPDMRKPFTARCPKCLCRNVLSEATVVKMLEGIPTTPYANQQAAAGWPLVGFIVECRQCHTRLRLIPYLKKPFERATTPQGRTIQFTLGGKQHSVNLEALEAIEAEVRKSTPAPDTAATLHLVEEMLDRGKVDEALKALGKMQDDRGYLENARGVCLMRAKQLKAAIDVYRILGLHDLPPLGKTFPTEFRCNFATALLLFGQAGGAETQLAHCDPEHAETKRLRKIMQDWRDGFSIWTRILEFLGYPSEPPTIASPGAIAFPSPST